jgi:hypothetical protein
MQKTEGNCIVSQVGFIGLDDGLAGSAVLNAKAPLVISRNFQRGFRIKVAPDAHGAYE